MTREELKELLQKYAKISDELEQIGQERERLRGLSYSLGSKGLGVSVQKGHSGDPVPRAVEALERMDERYALETVRLMAEQDYVENLIEGLDPTLRKLMRCRYIRGLGWERVCIEMRYSWRQTHNLHAKALDELLKTING